ncbi:MAG: lamin tail domain-containing protein [Patescibacteria group bacterium]
MKKYLLLGLLILFPSAARAGVSITEIMYDLAEGSDTGREWLEITNDSSAVVDLTDWKLWENETNHGLTLASGEASLAPGGRAIIADDNAKFQTDWPGVSVAIFSSAFSLNNIGETLVLKDAAGAEVNSVTYDSGLGANGDGRSLQLISGQWRAGAPTPGAASQESDPALDDTDEDTDGDSPSGISAATVSGGSARRAEREEVEPELKIKIVGRDRTGAVNAPLDFVATATGGTQPVWSFGDGASGSGSRVNHTYLFPGKYVVMAMSQSGMEQVSDRLMVNIIDPKITVAGVFNRGELAGMELRSSATAEINLSGWQVTAVGRLFIFPAGMMLAAGGRVTVPAMVLGFGLAPGEDISLVFPAGITRAASYRRPLSALPIAKLKPQVLKKVKQ